MNPTLQVQAIELRVPDLARSLDFYSRQLGFAVLRQAGGRAELGIAVAGVADPGPDAGSAIPATTESKPSGLLTLIEDKTARRAPAEAAGLFHVALLLPDRAALGNWLRRVAEQGVRFEGFSDHGVSEALYLSDPDGNGLEFYSDRPREMWPRAKNGTDLAMYTRPLDLDNLVAAGAAGRADALLTGARWGHLHLSVTNLDRSETFYKSALGMSLMVSLGDSARFLAADGYHHHLGLNTWAHATKPQPAGVLGLASATFAMAGVTAEQRLSDPDGMAIRVVPL
jgi:catechol 2,3-dioxygenase